MRVTWPDVWAYEVSEMTQGLEGKPGEIGTGGSTGSMDS